MVKEDGIVDKGELTIEDALMDCWDGKAGIEYIHGPYPANWEGLDLDHLKN